MIYFVFNSGTLNGGEKLLETDKSSVTNKMLRAEECNSIFLVLIFFYILLVSKADGLHRFYC